MREGEGGDRQKEGDPSCPGNVGFIKGNRFASLSHSPSLAAVATIQVTVQLTLPGRRAVDGRTLGARHQAGDAAILIFAHDAIGLSVETGLTGRREPAYRVRVGRVEAVPEPRV